MPFVFSVIITFLFSIKVLFENVSLSQPKKGKQEKLFQFMLLQFSRGNRAPWGLIR